MLPPSTILQGIHGRRYKILELLGKSPGAQVYQARASFGDQVVALKFFAAQYAFCVETLRLLGEQQLGSLDHPNITAVLDLDAYRDTPFVVMELVPGRSARDRLEITGVFSETDALQIARDAALALSHIQSHRVVHRNLKPSNLLLTSDGRAKLTDFGAADAPGFAERRMLPADLLPADLSHALAVTQGRPGTIPYMSPEQLSGAKLDTQSDIYSLGATLFELVTGIRPFEPNPGQPPARARLELAQRIVKQPPPSPNQRRRDLSAGTSALILKMLAKDPFHRFQTAADLVAAIDVVLAALGTSITASHPLDRPLLAGVREALADPTLTRRALIAGEIIGTPKALRNP